MLSVLTTPWRLSRNEPAIDRRSGEAVADNSVSDSADAAKLSGTRKTVRAISDGVAEGSSMRLNVQTKRVTAAGHEAGAGKNLPRTVGLELVASR